jgi:2-polyprenyl-3-methyl-5-hydroxy-6-metoxy-1,4-benzoquinol methylase
MDLAERQASHGDGARHPWELARFEVVNNLVGPILSKNHRARVLDLGCGDIFFATRLCLRHPGLQVYAVDTAFTPEIISEIQVQAEGLDIRLCRTLAEAGQKTDQPVDLVLLLDVIEHIADDVSFLRTLFSNPLVGPQTMVMITVPAYRSLFCSHDTFLGHFRRYTRSLLKRNTKMSGFVPVSSGYFFSTLLPARAVQVIKEKITPVKESTTGLVEWRGGKTLTALLKAVLWVDFRFTSSLKKLTGVSLPGLSTYILCRKSAS